jgi:hypothetical protein
METSSESSSVGRRGDDGDEALARALKNLELREGELDNVFIGEEDLLNLKKQARWLAVAKVNSRKPFSTSYVFDTLRGV